jgi:hypothetical protein
MPKKNNDKFPLRPLTNFHTISYSMFDGREGKSPIKRPAPSNFFSESIAPCDCGRPSSLGSAGDAPLTVRWQGRKMRIYRWETFWTPTIWLWTPTCCLLIGHLPVQYISEVIAAVICCLYPGVGIYLRICSVMFEAISVAKLLDSKKKKRKKHVLFAE